MAKRHEDAWFIQQGACNPCGVANSLVDACREVMTEAHDTQTVCDDPAVRLIVHQLAFLTGTHDVENGFTETGKDRYSILMEECTIRSPYAQIRAGNACKYPREEV